MDDLISREAAQRITGELLSGWLTDGERNILESVDADLGELPSVDAVEVVRCRDCKHFDGECCDRYADETLGYSHSTQPNFFCACGERKTDV